MSVGLRLLASISDNGSTSVLRMLDSDLLVDDQELSVYSFMRQHLRRYGELPTASTIEEQTQVRLPEALEHIDFYLGEVYNRKVYNGVRDQFAGLRASVVSNDVAAILAHATAIRGICTPYSGQQRELLTLSEVAPDVRAEYEHHASIQGLVSGVPTGWEYTDEQLGGHQNGDFNVIVARMGVGKTHLAIHGARAAWRAGKSVLFVSMEMTLKQIGMRLAAHHCGLDPDLARKGRLSWFGRRRLFHALETFETANNFHLFAGNFKKTTEDVDILIQELAPDIVYIDGLYLMKPAKINARNSRFDTVAYVVDDIKQMALMRNRPIVGTTQFNRQAGKGGAEGSLETMGYTDALGTHASVIIAVKNGPKQTVPIRRMVMNANDIEEVTTIGFKDVYPTRLLEIVKGREGEAGMFGINFGFAPTNFSQCAIEEATTSRQRRERGSSADARNLDFMQ